MVDIFIRFLQNRTQQAILIAGILLIPVLGFLDFLSGAEISFSVFYLLSVYLVSCYVGRWPAVLVSGFAATVWLAAELLTDVTYSHPLIPIWNMLARFFFFTLTALLLSELRVREERRRALECIFFHDVLNTMTRVRGFAELLHECVAPEQKEISSNILSAADQVIHEIEGQRILAAAEKHELFIDYTALNSRLVLEQTLAWYRHQGHEKAILRLATGSEDVIFSSDQAHLSRVLGNMVKNAMEAARPGDIVTAGCRKKGKAVEFWLHNPQHIPLEIQSRVFQPSFSTKGSGRGLGAYSMRLLSRELGGDVTFVSSPQDGTTFSAWFPLKESHT